jgi:hypothetical protein
MGVHHRIIGAMNKFTNAWAPSGPALQWLRLLALSCIALAAARASHAAGPALPGKAFVAPAPCRTDAFSDAGLDQQEREFEQTCGAAKAPLQFSNPDPRRLGMQADRLLTRADDPLRASVRLGWSGMHQAAMRTPAVTGQAQAAAGMRMRMTADWAIDVKFGRAAGAGPQMRNTLAALWRPGGENLLITQWSAEEAGLARSVGMRWWLMPGRVVFDLTARRPPTGGQVEPRIGLSWFGFRL